MNNFVYEEGDLVDTGSHGQDDLLYIDGDPVPNEGESSLVFEEGTGLGSSGPSYRILDNGNIGPTADFNDIEKAQTPGDWYGYDTDVNSSAGNDTRAYCESNHMNVFTYKNTNNGERYLFVVFNDASGSDGDPTTKVSGDTGGASFVVEDDPGDDTYAFGQNIDQFYTGSATDGYVCGPFTSGDTVTIDVNGLGSGLTDVRCVNADKSDIDYPISTDVSVEVMF